MAAGPRGFDVSCPKRRYLTRGAKQPAEVSVCCTRVCTCMHVRLCSCACGCDVRVLTCDVRMRVFDVRVRLCACAPLCACVL